MKKSTFYPRGNKQAIKGGMKENPLFLMQRIILEVIHSDWVKHFSHTVMIQWPASQMWGTFSCHSASEMRLRALVLIAAPEKHTQSHLELSRLYSDNPYNDKIRPPSPNPVTFPELIYFLLLSLPLCYSDSLHFVQGIRTTQGAMALCKQSFPCVLL